MKPVRSTAERIGFAALAGAAVLGAIHPAAAAAPLAAFVAACAAAPFLPRIGFFAPVVSRGPRNRPAVAITFDDGPDPATTPLLLDLLDRNFVKAAFFVVGKKVENHPELTRELVLRGHEVGCHSHVHDLLLGLKQPEAVCRDLKKAAAALERVGIRPLAFRPPVGIVTPRIASGLSAAGMYMVTFSRRGWDAGNRRLAGLSDRILCRLGAGDVIVLHDSMPETGDRRGLWLSEVEKIVAGIHSRGLSIVPLQTLIGRPVMEKLTGPASKGR